MLQNSDYDKNVIVDNFVENVDFTLQLTRSPDIE